MLDGNDNVVPDSKAVSKHRRVQLKEFVVDMRSKADIHNQRFLDLLESKIHEIKQAV